MARKTDGVKLDQWRDRFDRFRVSGLTMAAFCRYENVTPNRFYYWAQRLQEANALQPTKPIQPKPADVSSAALSDSIVEISLGHQATIRLPASESELIHSVLAWWHAIAWSHSGDDQSGSHSVGAARQTQAAFQRIDFNHASAR